ncbi:MAG: alpha/beta hydrolase [Nitrospinae bacterium]|nr:alpha/beta hydrolase [Nitrospinota bacterium]
MAVLLWVFLAVLAGAALFQAFLYAVRWYETYDPATDGHRSWLSALSENGFKPVGAYMAELVYSAVYAASALVWLFVWLLKRDRAVFDPSKLTPGRPSVVLIHGIFGWPGLFWLFRRRLAARSIVNVVTFTYKNSSLPLSDYRVGLRDLVMRIKAVTGSAEVALAGHSFGGMIAFDYAMEYGNEGEVRGVAAMGTPFGGSKLAALGLTPLARSLHPSNPFFGLVKTLKPKAPFLNVYSVYDQFVIPWQSGAHPLADESVVVAAHGHSGFYFDYQVIKTVAEWVETKVGQK